MNKRQEREYATILTTREFLRSLEKRPPALTSILATLDDVARRVADLSGHTSNRADRGAVSVFVRQAIQQLRRGHMIPVARRGRILFRGEPRLIGATKVPHKKATPDDVVKAAESMIKAVRPHKNAFIAAGRPRTFLTDLAAATKRLREALKTGKKRRAASPDAFFRLRTEIARGRREIKSADGEMIAWLESLPGNERTVLAARWRTAHRIGARLGRPKRRPPTGDPNETN